MGTVLTQDDFAEKLLVTIHSYKQRKIEVSEGLTPDIQALVKMNTGQPANREGMGIPMEIADINLPYICVKFPVFKVTSFITTAIFDTREVNFMKISESFAKKSLGDVIFNSLINFDAVTGKINNQGQTLANDILPKLEVNPTENTNLEVPTKTPLKARKKKNDKPEDKGETDSNEL